MTDSAAESEKIQKAFWSLRDSRDASELIGDIDKGLKTIARNSKMLDDLQTAGLLDTDHISFMNVLSDGADNLYCMHGLLQASKLFFAKADTESGAIGRKRTTTSLNAMPEDKAAELLLTATKELE